jgi:hypothetical protein
LRTVPDLADGHNDQFIRLTCSEPGRTVVAAWGGQARCRALEDERQVTITLELDLIVKMYGSLS